MGGAIPWPGLLDWIETSELGTSIPRALLPDCWSHGTSYLQVLLLCLPYPCGLYLLKHQTKTDPSSLTLYFISATEKVTHAITQRTLVSGAFLWKTFVQGFCSLDCREILWDLSLLPVLCGPMLSCRTPALLVWRGCLSGHRRAHKKGGSQGLLHLWSPFSPPPIALSRIPGLGLFILSVTQGMLFWWLPWSHGCFVSG